MRILPARISVLQALNEFVLLPGSGFETHPHKEMEIITYCVEGELTHADSLTACTLQGGSVQYLCAGSGITHRERIMTARIERCAFIKSGSLPRQVN